MVKNAKCLARRKRSVHGGSSRFWWYRAGHVGGTRTEGPKPARAWGWRTRGKDTCFCQLSFDPASPLLSVEGEHGVVSAGGSQVECQFWTHE